MPKRLVALAVALLLAPSLALARAPEPKKPLDLDRFMGRWYEIFRTPNAAQSNCHAAYQVWSRVAPDRFAIAQTCHQDTREGPIKVVNTPARLVDPAVTTKFEASFFGGLIKKQYWVLDHADDYSWMIASTSGGGYVSLLTRKPGLPETEQAEFKRRISAMGLNADKLVAVGAAG